jgi:hypothetical protein
MGKKLIGESAYLGPVRILPELSISAADSASTRGFLSPMYYEQYTG